MIFLISLLVITLAIFFFYNFILVLIFVIPHNYCTKNDRHFYILQNN